MSDEWSLKGKRVWSFDDLNFEDTSDAVKYLPLYTRKDAENNIWTKQYCYIEGNIETLRRKLIDDFIHNEYLKDLACNKENIITSKEYNDAKKELDFFIIGIINKRFGVD